MPARKPVETTSPPLLTIAQVATRLSVSVGTVRRLIKAGQLPAASVGLGTKKHHWRIDPADLERFLALQQPEPPRPRKRERLPPGFSSYF